MAKRSVLFTALMAATMPLTVVSEASAGDSTKCASNGRVWACMRVKANSVNVNYVSTYTGRAPLFNGVDDGAVEYRIAMLDGAKKPIRTWPAIGWNRRRPSQSLDNMCTWFSGNLSWTNASVPCVAWPSKYLMRVEVNVPGTGNNPVSGAVTIQK